MNFKLIGIPIGLKATDEFGNARGKTSGGIFCLRDFLNSYDPIFSF